jgi:hypothetical protein
VPPMDAELERFKTEIDLRQFAASVGFTLNRRDSWRGSAVMERGAADKIIITRDDDGHYVYFSVKDDHSGTIIDLAKRYLSPNFGEIRKALRAWSGAGFVPSSVPLEKTPRDLAGVAREWHQANDYESHVWLERDRRIPASTIHSPRFAGRLKTDLRGNVLFPHENIRGELCGFEKKNRGSVRSFTGFAAGGEKGLGCSHDHEGDRRIVFAESFIDMLSYAALFPDPSSRYRSFAGGLNPDTQPALIRAHIAALPAGSEVIAATDQDEDGAKFAGIICDIAESLGTYTFREDRPALKDWNDVLKSPPLPTARQAAEPKSP